VKVRIWPNVPVRMRPIVSPPWSQTTHGGTDAAPLCWGVFRYQRSMVLRTRGPRKAEAPSEESKAKATTEAKTVAVWSPKSWRTRSSTTARLSESDSRGMCFKRTWLMAR